MAIFNSYVKLPEGKYVLIIIEIETGWWLTYPSEKILVSWVIIPNIWKNKKCSKPPTRKGSTGS